MLPLRGWEGGGYLHNSGLVELKNLRLEAAVAVGLYSY